MQTIRILNPKTGEMVEFTGIAYRVETEELRQQYPEGRYIWLR